MEKNMCRKVILGIDRENSGTFEHAFEFAKNMVKRGFNVDYYSHWFDGPIKKLNLEDETSEVANQTSVGTKGIFYLQSHTWESDGLLDKINCDPNSTMVMNLHAIIPYFYLPTKSKRPFLEGKLDPSEIDRVIYNKMSDRERDQLRAIEKSDYLITISEGHKIALERLGFEKKIGVFENVSDISSLGEDLIEEASLQSLSYRDKIDAENVLLYCGRLGLSKGDRDLFKAFEEIKGTYNSSKLLLLGTKEENKLSLSDKGLSKELLDSVMLVPWIDKNTLEGRKEFVKYYLASDVLVQPMVTDSLYSKTVIDAMDLGVPTITCRSNYTIGSSETSEEIVESFDFFKSYPGDVRSIAQRAQEKVRRENTWDSYISRLEEFVK